MTESLVKTVSAADPSAIGALLVDAGVLSIAQAEEVLRAQKQWKMRFGEAAVHLGLVTPDDIDRVLAEQFAYPYSIAGQGGLHPDLVAAHAPFSATVEPLRVLRTQLMLRWLRRQDAPSLLAIASSSRGDGRSRLAANLAVLFAQAGDDTLVIDADLRHPRQHELFNLENTAGLSNLLAGRCGDEVIQQVAGIPRLSVLCAGSPAPNSQELLSRPALRALLTRMRMRYEVVIIDTSAFEAGAEAQLIVAHGVGTLAVVRTGSTREATCLQMLSALRGAGATLLGTVLNGF